MRKNKIIIITIALIFLFLLNLKIIFSEQASPYIIVKTLIESAQKNDLEGVLATADLVKISTAGHSSMDPEDFIAFLKEIDLDKVEFQKIDGKMGDEKMLVRILKPISYDFELERQARYNGKPNYRYRVVSVHP